MGKSEKVRGFIVALDDLRAIFLKRVDGGRFHYYLKPWNSELTENEEIYVTWRTNVNEVIDEIEDVMFIRDKAIDLEIIRKKDEFLLLDVDIDEFGKVTLI